MLKEIDTYKKISGERAAEFIEDGMIIGLGSGSTVYWMMKRLGDLVAKGFKIQGVPSSNRTERWAEEFGIPLTDFGSVQSIDLAIDGADEIDNRLNLIKGGGGSLVREKIVDALADKLIIIADESKMVTTLGNFPLPVEVVPFGWEVTARNITQLGCTPTIRQKNGEIFVSDNGNYILDCQFSDISNPKQLHSSLKSLVGVVETGLFIDMAELVIVGCNEGVSIVK
ncbi:ribose-5-phosphate isomerase A [Lentibacillus populi]|uniref:Ribose-5-phosphate isomerase A n=1 Tax=Lentibacillus populi TaxID=1827502 RepID=A0A9W5X6A1_9BACI|nr:ribose-5-phosphate isomerase RpiA [Lentibacillus populi]GGB45818.1 ribose-5-phosphate isomerase A [Lentibacillus populi]